MGQTFFVVLGLGLVAASFNFAGVQSACAFGASVSFGLSTLVSISLDDPMGVKKQAATKGKKRKK